MKYLFFALMTIGLSATLNAQEVKDPPTDSVKNQPAAPVRTDNQQILDQEDVQEREEMEEGDVLDEFGNNTYNDNGNGTTTNPKVDWPEP